MHAIDQIRRRVALEVAGVEFIYDGRFDRAALGRKIVNLSPFALLPLTDRDPAIQAGLGKYVGHHLNSWRGHRRYRGHVSKKDHTLRDAGGKRTKTSAALANKWNAAVGEALLEAGGVLVYDSGPNSLLAGESYQRYEVTGPYGVAVVVPQGNWLAVCFDNPSEGSKYLVANHAWTGGVFNPYSGKWNHHYFGADFAAALDAAKQVIAVLSKGATK